MPDTPRDVFEAIADPTRREILALLASAAMHVGELSQHFELSRPAISRHLRVLREADLVRERKVGRQRLYALRPWPLRDVRMWIAHFDQFWGVKLKNLKSRLEDVG